MSLLSFILVLSFVPAAVFAQPSEPSRIFEFGITGGLSHHDFHYRYPGEGRWEDPLGLRLDARLRVGDRGAVGVALVGDRYVYSLGSAICLYSCLVPTPAGGSNSNLIWFSTAWQLTRLGVGATWQQQLFGPLHGNLGVLAGRTWRQTLDGAPVHETLPADTTEWFAGGEAGVTLHWRDLAFGIGGEYGRVPRTHYALSPYYSRIVGRVAYRTGW